MHYLLLLQNHVYCAYIVVTFVYLILLSRN